MSSKLDSITELLETSDFDYTGYLSFVKRREVFVRFVNMATIPELLMAITFDGSGTGAYTDVEVGMTVIFYSGNTDTIKGYGRVAYGGSTATVLQINEMAEGELDLEDNDRFAVVEDYGIHHMLVSNTIAFLKDSRRVYVDEGDAPPAISNSGGPIVGFVDPVTGLLTASGYGDTSIRVQTADDDDLEHDWAFGSGATPSTSTDENPTDVTFPAGFRFAKHDTTDPNGKVSRQQVPIWAHERTGDNAPMPVQMQEINQSDENGIRGSFIIPTTDAELLALLYHGAFCVYWELETRNGVAASYGSGVPERGHVKLAAYLDAESIEIDAENDTISFDLLGTLPVLENTPALNQIVISDNPDDDPDWQHMDNLTVWRVLWYIAWWGSTFNLIHDFLYSDGIDLLFERLAVEGATIAEQLRDIAASLNLMVLNDRLGRLLFIRNPNYLTDAQRNARTTTIDLSTGLIVRIKVRLEHRRQGRLVEGQGITVAKQPVFSKAPGNAPGSGTQSDTLSKQVVLNQDDLDRRTAERFAEIDGTYYTASTKSYRKVPMGVEVRIIGAADVFDVGLGEYVRLILPASTNRRGVSFGTADRWRLRSQTITYDAEKGTKEIVLILDHETHSAFAKAQPKPIEPDVPGVDFDDWQIDPIDIEIAPLPIVGPILTTVGIGANRLLVSGTAGPYAARGISEDGFQTLGLTTFEDISSGLLGLSHWWHVIPQDLSRFLQITSEGLFRARPLDSIFVGWEQIATNTELWGASDRVSVDMNLHIGYPGYCVLTSGNMLAISTNIMAATPTWTKVNATGGAASDSYSTDMNNTSGFPIDIALDQQGSGALYASIYWGGVSGYEQRIYRNLHWGLSGGWTQVLGSWPGATFGQWELLIPYLRPNGALNKDDANMVSFCVASRNGQWTIARSVNRAVNYGAIDGDASWYEEAWGGFGKMRRSAMVWDGDGKAMWAMTKQTGGLNTVYLTYTDDAGAANPVWTLPFAMGDRALVNLGHHPGNKKFVLASSPGNLTAWDGGSGGFLVASPDQVNLVDLMGPTNLATILTSTRVAYSQIA